MDLEDRAIVEAVQRALALPPGFVLTPDMTPPMVPGWDSIGWLNVIGGIEQEFAIELDFEALESVYNVEQLCALVVKTHQASR